MSPPASHEPTRRDLPPLGFEVRTAIEADAGGIVAVWLTRHEGDREASMSRIGEEIGMAQRAEGRIVLVAVLKGEVVGYGRARLWTAEEVAGHLNCPAGWWLSGSLVLSACRRRGIGRTLMSRRLEMLNAPVHSMVNATNRASLGCHYASGFEDVTREFTAPGTRNPDEPMVLLRSPGNVSLGRPTRGDCRGPTSSRTDR